LIFVQLFTGTLQGGEWRKPVGDAVRLTEERFDQPFTLAAATLPEEPFDLATSPCQTGHFSKLQWLPSLLPECIQK
jgi:hypothetical protein